MRFGFQNESNMSSLSVLLASNWHPKSTKKINLVSNVEKVAPGSQNVSIWDPPTFDFALKTHENHTFRKFNFFSPSDLLDPKSHQNELQMAPKSSQKSIKIDTRYAFDFRTHFYRFFVDFGLPKGSPGRAHEPPFSHFFASWDPGAPRTPPKSPQDPPNHHFS